MPTDLTIGIAGSGGDGVILLGEVLARAAARAGLHAVLVKSFGPQIRGGESSVRLRVSDRPVSDVRVPLDALLLFHFADLAPFSAELVVDSVTKVFVDSGATAVGSALPDGLRAGVLRPPLEELAISSARTKQAKNMVAAGVLAQRFGWPEEQLTDAVRARFSRHGSSTLGANLLALQAGREWARENVPGRPGATPGIGSINGNVSTGDGEGATTDVPGDGAGPTAPLYFLSGNEAFCLGALAAGCRFMAGYPISPASEILEFMARQLPRFGGHCVQAEDEIAAVCMAIGASYGGVRALTATSGPGFSLKQEAIGLAHMAEIPLVVCDVQRCGPSTGIPTRTEQADLSIAIWGGHGDNPRVVLAATGIEDCAALAQTAFAIAEKYQTPVIVLLDQAIAQSQQTVAKLELGEDVGGGLAPPRSQPVGLAEPDSGQPAADRRAGTRPAPTVSDNGGVPPSPYHRYAITPSGISPRSIPGQIGGEYVAVGIEHGEAGGPASSQANHQAQTAKRFRKLAGVAAEYPLLRMAGAAHPRLALLTWGSSFGVCADAAEQLTAAGIPTGVLAPQLLSPLPVAQIEDWLAGVERAVVIELNYGGQLFRHLRGYVNLPPGTLSFCRAGGSPINLRELLSYLEGLGLS